MNIEINILTKKEIEEEIETLRNKFFSGEITVPEARRLSELKLALKEIELPIRFR